LDAARAAYADTGLAGVCAISVASSQLAGGRSVGATPWAVLCVGLGVSAGCSSVFLVDTARAQTPNPGERARRIPHDTVAQRTLSFHSFFVRNIATFPVTTGET